MIYIKQHLSLLGKKVEDRVTGLKGVVASISFDLYGCIQAVVNPGLDKDGKPKDQGWYDVNRLKILSKEPVMAVPDFAIEEPTYAASGQRGAAEKPKTVKL